MQLSLRNDKSQLLRTILGFKVCVYFGPYILNMKNLVPILLKFLELTSLLHTKLKVQSFIQSLGTKLII